MVGFIAIEIKMTILVTVVKKIDGGVIFALGELLFICDTEFQETNMYYTTSPTMSSYLYRCCPFVFY